ncbi:hypothetical protein PDE_00379 [Penicillium oxalicum 114-2]|uniref:Uncharacterized protein n=1 Tax=Penicillium oxalicum (strain 114-2 / CGMCC 5302) TaxID=933388 RepID=S7Z9U5_PENO1|nr:hypothetical protein PDE_00379 [Penicillium oxalicum 114-2]
MSLKFKSKLTISVRLYPRVPALSLEGPIRIALLTRKKAVLVKTYTLAKIFAYIRKKDFDPNTALVKNKKRDLKVALEAYEAILEIIAALESDLEVLEAYLVENSDDNPFVSIKKRLENAS